MNFESITKNIDKLPIKTTHPLGAVVSLGILLAGAGFKFYKEGRKGKGGNRKENHKDTIREYIVKNLICKFTLLDSNIWMVKQEQEKLIDFIFKFCAENNCKVWIPSFQLREFQQPKDENNRFIKTLAKQRIERYQLEGLVKFETYEQTSSYVDDSLLDYIEDKSRSHSEISFITEDRELRIRANGMEDLKDILRVNRISHLEVYVKKYKF